ncbi:hypothetical protein ABFA07_008641 [Porites harrisoni]
MAENTKMFLIACMVVACFPSTSSTNPMQQAIKSVHCVIRGYTFTVQVVGCQQRSVTVNTCVGTCLSFSTPSGLTGTKYYQVKSCTCCQPIRTAKVDVGLWCQDNADPSKMVRYYHPIETVTECACASC